MGRLAQELFELARLESGLVRLEPEVFSLPELMHDVAQKFELAAEARRQRLHMEIPPDLPAVRADLGLIERVLTNLLDNAIRHTPPGGDIALRLARLPQGLRVQVADTGEGIPASLRAGLFTRASALSHGARRRRVGTGDRAAHSAAAPERDPAGGPRGAGRLVPV